MRLCLFVLNDTSTIYLGGILFEFILYLARNISLFRRVWCFFCNFQFSRNQALITLAFSRKETDGMDFFFWGGHSNDHVFQGKAMGYIMGGNLLGFHVSTAFMLYVVLCCVGLGYC